MCPRSLKTDGVRSTRSPQTPLSPQMLAHRPLPLRALFLLGARSRFGSGCGLEKSYVFTLACSSPTRTTPLAGGATISGSVANGVAIANLLANRRVPRVPKVAAAARVGATPRQPGKAQQQQQRGSANSAERRRAVSCRRRALACLVALLSTALAAPRRSAPSVRDARSGVALRTPRQVWRGRGAPPTPPPTALPTALRGGSGGGRAVMRAGRRVGRRVGRPAGRRPSLANAQGREHLVRVGVGAGAAVRVRVWLRVRVGVRVRVDPRPTGRENRHLVWDPAELVVRLPRPLAPQLRLAIRLGSGLGLALGLGFGFGLRLGLGLGFGFGLGLGFGFG